jgi:hypothetical protein
MNPIRNLTAIVAALVAIATLSYARPSQATVLTFEGLFGAIDQSYGDRVAGNMAGGYTFSQMGEGFTPNVVVDYDPSGGAPRTWPSGYGDLTRVLYESDRTAKLQVKFTADPGFRVRLERWEMATWSSTLSHPNGETINGVAVYGADGTPLFSQANVHVPIVGHITFGPFATPLVDTMLTLEIDALNITTGFRNEDIGLDNVVFSQVPEPDGGCC